MAKPIDNSAKRHARMVSVTLFVRHDQLERLREQSRKNGQAVSALIRRAIDRMIPGSSGVK